MSRKQRREPSAPVPSAPRPPDPAREAAPAAPRRDPAAGRVPDRGEIRSALLFLALPFLSQWLQRGDLGMRLVDAAIFLPAVAVYYAIHKTLYPNRVVYWGALLLLLLGDAGSGAFAFIGLFAVCAGMLFVTLPALAAGPMYLRGRFERLSVARDYLLAGLRVTGVASALFCAAVAPHLFGARAVAVPPGTFTGMGATTTAAGLPVAVRTHALPGSTPLAALAAHVEGQVNRPWFTRPLVARSGRGFAATFRTSLPFFRRTFTYLVEPGDAGTVLRLASCDGDHAGHLLPLAPPEAPAPAAAETSPWSLDSLPVSGVYDPRALTLLSKEMAEDSGLTGERVFVSASLEGCMIQALVQPADPAVPFPTYAAAFETAVLKRLYPDFKVSRNERFPLSGREAFVVEGEVSLDGKPWRLTFAIADVDGKLLTLQATSAAPAAAAFDPVFRAFVAGTRIAPRAEGEGPK